MECQLEQEGANHWHMGLLRWLRGKEPSCQWRRRRGPGLDPWVGKIPWRRQWQPTPVFLPGKSHGQRSLVGYSPWGRKRVRHDLGNCACMQAYTDTRNCMDTSQLWYARWKKADSIGYTFCDAICRPFWKRLNWEKKTDQLLPETKARDLITKGHEITL